MNRSLTRRLLLRAAGAVSMSAAASGALRAEGGAAPSSAPTDASRTPMRIGGVALRVRDAERVAAFYRDVLGLAVLERTPERVRLGAGGATLVTLLARADAPREPDNAAGLFHTAFLMPTRKDLARWLAHVARHRTPLTGFADHHVSEAVYLDDPEGNGVEVYADRPRDQWRWDGADVAMGTEQLDIDGLLSLTDLRVSDYAQAPDGLRIGHMHLRVGDLARADAFYRDALGFDVTRRRGGAAFLSSGRYHHHLGLNVWRSAGAGLRDVRTLGVDWFSIEVDSAALLDARRTALGDAAAESHGAVDARDPWGTRVIVTRA